jgi:hypothetical protein
VSIVLVFKRFERSAFVLLLAVAIGFLVAGVSSLVTGGPNTGKLLASAGLLGTAAGVFQLEISGLFEKIMSVYGDEERFPYGPPSHITRQIISSPDRKFRSAVRDRCFFNVATGFWLIVVGTLVQFAAAWA